VKNTAYLGFLLSVEWFFTLGRAFSTISYPILAVEYTYHHCQSIDFSSKRGYNNDKRRALRHFRRALANAHK